MQPVVIGIKEGPQLHGVPVDLDALPFKTVFGPVSIPINQIAGIRTADDPRQQATICLSNGDSLTGRWSRNSITIKTEWGSATIDCDHIVSIVTTDEPVTWRQVEGRWRIGPVESVAPATDSADTHEKAGEVPAGAPTLLDSAPPPRAVPSVSVPEPAAAPSSK